MSSYPTLEELGAQGIRVNVNPEARRLYWMIQSSPISGAVFVLDSLDDPLGPRQPYVQKDEVGDGDGAESLHPISQLSVSEPKVSSITVTVDAIEDWYGTWYDFHYYEDEEDFEGPCYCCNRMPPPPGENLTVTAGEGGFVTVADYITAVHPWLASLRGDLLWALSMDQDHPLPEDTTLMADLLMIDDVWVDEVEGWLRNRGMLARRIAGQA